MSISKLFEQLDAPLKSVRWSWGAVSKTGEVYLRVWQDEFEKNGGKLWARLTRHSAFVARPRIHPGWQERLRHVATEDCPPRAP